MIRSRTPLLIPAALIALVMTVAALPARAATFPYVNDFSASVSDFTETTDAQWTLNAPGGKYNNTIAAAEVSSSSMLQVTNLGGAPATATPFRVQTTFTINALTAGNLNTTIGLAALGADANSADASGGFYLADVQVGGTLRLFEINPNTSLQTGTFAGGALQTGVPYTLTLDGTYSGSTINFLLTLTDGTNTTSISATDSTSVLTGQFFGLRDRTSGVNSVLNVDFDSFAITPVPEPTALGAIALGGMMLAARRRRRRE